MLSGLTEFKMRFYLEWHNNHVLVGTYFQVSQKCHILLTIWQGFIASITDRFHIFINKLHHNLLATCANEILVFNVWKQLL